MQIYKLDQQTITEMANQIKEVFLEGLVTENEITQDQANKMNEYAIIMAEKGFFGELWDKIIWKNNNHLNITVVKIIK